MCINEKHAAQVVKNALSISGIVTAQELGRGFSSAKLFIAISDSTRYVVRFLMRQSPKKLEQETEAMKIASQEGYGPHLYFIDPKKSYVIMEYLKNQPISYEQRQSDKLYEALASLLRKIHHGSFFLHKRNIFGAIRNDIKILYTKNFDRTLLAKIEDIITRIEHAITPYLTSVPSHNDLNP